MKCAFADETARSADFPTQFPFSRRDLAAVWLRLCRGGRQPRRAWVMRTVTTILEAEFKGIGVGYSGTRES